MSQAQLENAKQAPPATFDEQVWPINLALLVLTGFVAGAILALSDFADPRPLHSGWARLAALALTVGLLVTGVNYIESRRLRRNLQLAIVLSCLVHFILLVVLYNQRTAAATHLATERSETGDPAATQSEVSLSDYSFEATDQLLQDLEKPVEVQAPSPSTPTPIARDVMQSPDRVAESQPTPLPGAAPDVQMRTDELPALQQSAPRRGEEPSVLSRRMTEVDLNPRDPISAPQADAGSDPGTGGPQAASLTVARHSSATDVRSAADAAAPLPAPAQQAVRLARRESAEPEASRESSVSMLSRRVNQPAAVPRSSAESPETAAGLERPTSMQPQVVLSRREAAGPQAFMQQSPEPKAAASVQIGRLDVARADRSDQPLIASAPLKAMGRSAADATLPASVTAADLQTAPGVGSAPGSAAPGSGLPTSVAPAAIAVVRGQSEALPGAGEGAQAAMSAAAAEQTAGGAGPSLAGLPAGSGETSATPTLHPEAPADGALARATVAGAVEASPVQVDSPAGGSPSGASGPEAGPAPTSVSKGSAGGFGGGLEQNLGGGISDNAAPAAVASISASRAANLQNGPEGPALAPSSTALGGRSVAGANIQSATLVATADAGMADALGGARAGSLDASAGAAVQKADGRGQPGPVSAAAGSGAIDISPTQVVANVGRAAIAGGGGGPLGHLSVASTQLARSGAGGGALPALATATVAAVPAAPAGDGGGGGAAGQGAGAGGGPGVGPVGGLARAGGSGDLPAGLAAGGGVVVQNPSGGGGAGEVAAGPVVQAGGGGAEALPGVATSGSSKFPSRSLGQALAADLPGAAQLPAGPAEAELPGSSPGQAGGSPTPVRSAAGLPGGNVAGPVGAVAGATSVDSPIVGSPGLGIGPPAPPATGEQAPAVGSLATSGPLRRTNVAGLAGGQGLIGSAGIAIDVPAVEGAAGGLPLAQPSGSPAVGAPGRGSAGLPVQVAALDGPGGLGTVISPQVGSLSNRAQRDAEIVHAGRERFLSRSVGGVLKVDGKAREPARAFSGRGGQRMTKQGQPPDQFPERTEESVERGLDFLARHQSPDGRWSFNGFGAGRPGYEHEEAAFRSDTAATGLALLAFLGAGYDHYDDRYQNAIRGGLEFLVRNQKPNGDLYLPADAESNKSAWFYSHGIASIALCEAYGMTGDEKLKEAAQGAINFIAASQHPTRGGWRYAPQFDADTSVSGWQLMALKSGELAGLKIPPGTYERVRHWLDSAQAAPGDPAQYVYNPNAPNTIKQRHGRRPTTTMTAVGLLMRLYTGWNRNDPRMAAGAKHLMQHLPEIGTAAQPQRDTYYWYYATQVMFHMKGEYWKAWNEKLRPMLLEKQIRSGPLAGSWDPLGPIPDKWGPHAGRIYVTTLNLLSLEVNYRHLPIYESEAK